MDTLFSRFHKERMDTLSPKTNKVPKWICLMWFLYRGWGKSAIRFLSSFAPVKTTCTRNPGIYKMRHSRKTQYRKSSSEIKVFETLFSLLGIGKSIQTPRETATPSSPLTSPLIQLPSSLDFSSCLHLIAKY